MKTEVIFCARFAGPGVPSKRAQKITSVFMLYIVTHFANAAIKNRRRRRRPCAEYVLENAPAIETNARCSSTTPHCSQTAQLSLGDADFAAISRNAVWRQPLYE